MTDAERFLAQNEGAANQLTEDDLATVEMYAEHHAGGLFVLWRQTDQEGIYVKMHDDWGGDTDVIVHTYSADDPDVNAVESFDNGHDALARFLEVEGIDPNPDTAPDDAWSATPRKD